MTILQPGGKAEMEKEEGRNINNMLPGEDLLQFFFSNVEGTPFSYINKKPNSIKIVRIRK